MAKSVNVEIITPSKLFYMGEAELVVVKTLSGYEGFMAGHTWAVKLLDIGELSIQEKGKSLDEFKVAAIHGGFIDVQENIIIYTDAAEWQEDIDMDRAMSLKESAQAFLDAHKQSTYAYPTEQDDEEIVRARMELQKAITRMKVANGGRRGVR